MENLEKQSPDFEKNINVTRYNVIVEEDNLNNAVKDARIISDGTCGPFGAKTLYIQNESSLKSIGVTIEIKWNYQNETRTENRVYTVYPQQRIILGCPIPGPTSQQFNYKILAAWYV